MLFSPAVAAARHDEPLLQQDVHEPIPARKATAQFRAFLPQIIMDQRPSSFTLIAEALASGELDDETALIYRVFATFGDDRLPVRFQGDNTGLVDSDAVAEATARFSALSDTARATLAPFLMPPVYQGSWYDLRMNGQRAETAAGALMAVSPAAPALDIGDLCVEEAQGLLNRLNSTHFVVWYPTLHDSYRITATQMIADLETRIYPILAGRMRAPLGDARMGCNPDDDRLDIYLAPGAAPARQTTIAYVTPYAGCKGAPTYMVVLQPDWAQIGVLAHEFMHMIQFAYNPPDGCLSGESTVWWMEASANWAIDFFEDMDPQPDLNMEHGYVDQYLTKAQLALRSTVSSRQYGAYLWPFYLTHYRSADDSAWMASFYTAIEQQGAANFYSVMNELIEGGFAERWPQFALYNLNRAPVNQYERWDNLKQRWGQWKKTPVSAMHIDLADRPIKSFYIGHGAPNSAHMIFDLGIQYISVTVDSDVRLLAFANTFVGKPNIRVQALIKTAGQGWQPPQDWSEHKWTVLCRDLPDERAEEMIVVISNSNSSGSEYSAIHSDGLPRIVASNLSCAGWQGAAQWQIDGFSENEESRVTYVIVGEAQPEFELTSRTVADDTVQLEFQPVAGQVNWSMSMQGENFQSGQIVTCERNGLQDLTPARGGLLITERLDDSHPDRQFFGGGITPVQPEELCPALEHWTDIPWLQTGADLQPWEGEEGAVLRGSVSETVSDPGYSRTTVSSWDLAGGGP